MVDLAYIDYVHSLIDLRSSNAQPMSARGLDHASASMDMARVSIPEPRSLVNLNTSSVPDLRSEAISRMTTPSQLDPAKQTRWQAFFSSTSSPVSLTCYMYDPTRTSVLRLQQ